MEHRERAHKLAKVDDVVLLRVKDLKHAVREQVAALLRLEERQRKLVLVDAAILRAQEDWLASWQAMQYGLVQYTALKSWHKGACAHGAANC